MDITFQVLADREFKRKEFDILSTIEINVAQAALGDKIDVKTLDGLVKLKIPAGIQSGKEFILRGKGVPILGRENSRGNQVVTVLVKVPEKLNRKAKKLFEELKGEL